MASQQRFVSRTTVQLGMPHTMHGALGEVALLSMAGHQRWVDLGDATGCPAARQTDGEGRAVYASFYFVDVRGFPDAGLAVFGPEDKIEMVSTLVRFGRSMLDGEHRLYPAGRLPATLPGTLPEAPLVRLSNVLVSAGTGMDDLKITTPANAPIERVPVAPREPDSYRTIRDARERGAFFETPADAAPLWPRPHTVTCAINPDRDVNGVGLLYFCNYVVFMDLAERRAGEETGALAPAALDGRTTVRRRIGFYGNALPSDLLDVEVEAFALDPDRRRLLLHHRVRRRSDGRLIAVASAEKRLRAG